MSRGLPPGGFGATVSLSIGLRRAPNRATGTTAQQASRGRTGPGATWDP